MTNTQNEIWKDVVGFEGLYKVSSIGRVMSLSRIVDNGFNKRVTRDKILNGSVDKGGYRVVTVIGCKTFKVHRLVATAFIENTHNKPCVNHKDGNKLNNHVSNLEWATVKENMEHMYKVLYTEPHNNYKLNKENVLEIRRRCSHGETSAALGKEFGVTNQLICDIKNRKRWGRV